MFINDFVFLIPEIITILLFILVVGALFLRYKYREGNLIPILTKFSLNFSILLLLRRINFTIYSNTIK